MKKKTITISTLKTHDLCHETASIINKKLRNSILNKSNTER